MASETSVRESEAKRQVVVFIHSSPTGNTSTPHTHTHTHTYTHTRYIRSHTLGEDHSDTGSSCSSSEGDGCRGDGDGGESVETPTVDPAKLLEKILFGDSGSSEEDSDWIVSDFEDFMPNSDSRLPMEEVSLSQPCSLKSHSYNRPSIT